MRGRAEQPARGVDALRASYSVFLNHNTVPPYSTKTVSTTISNNNPLSQSTFTQLIPPLLSILKSWKTTRSGSARPNGCIIEIGRLLPTVEAAPPSAGRFSLVSLYSDASSSCVRDLSLLRE